MRNQAQIKAAITSLRNNTDNAGQAKRPLHKLALTLTISTLALWATDAWAKTDAAWDFTGSMSVGRFSFTATLLQNGKVLVAGGTIPGNLTTNTAELHDPATGTFTTTGNMKEGRQQHSAVLLNDGTALVTGGNIDRTPCTTAVCVNTIAESELYNPSTGQWQKVGDMTIL